MKKHISLWLVMFLAIWLVLPVCLMAQSSMKLTLESSTGDRISTPGIKSFSMGTDNNLVIYLDQPFNFQILTPDIWVDNWPGTYSGCTVSLPASVNATQPASGTDFPITFKIKSASGATFAMPVSPELGVASFGGTDGRTFSWNIGGTGTTQPAAVGSYLAVFEGTSVGATNKSQLVVMIKITSPETVYPPTAISPLSGAINQAINFTASGAYTSLQHAVEYSFDWGDSSSGGSSWSTSSQAHTYTSTGTYTIKAKARCVSDQVESALFSATLTISEFVETYTLTTSVSPSGAGSITVSPAGPYNPGTVVTVNAMTNQGYFFSSWGVDAYGSVNPTTVTMNGNKNVIAYFSGGVSTCTAITWGNQWGITLQKDTETCYVGTVPSGKTYLSWSLYGTSQELLADVIWTFPDGSTRTGNLMGDNVNTSITVYDPVPPGEYKVKITCTQSGSLLIRPILSPM